MKEKDNVFIKKVSTKSKEELLQEQALLPEVNREQNNGGEEQELISMPKKQSKPKKAKTVPTVQTESNIMENNNGIVNEREEEPIQEVNATESAKEESKPSKPYPVIGIALGGGGSLGLAHIGVIKVLQQNGIHITKWAGTSMGSIVGAFFCSGYKVNKLHKIANQLRGYHMLDMNFAGKGLLNGKAVERIIKKYIPANKTFAQLKFEFRCNAVDLYSGKEVVLKEGNVLKAIRSSFSVPGIFAPTKMDDMLLIDGGLLNNVPDNIVKDMGADIVIAVNVINAYPEKPQMKSIRDIIYLSSLAAQVQMRSLQPSCADVVIEPRVENYKQYVFNKNLANEVIKLGEKAAKEALPQILQKIIDFQNQAN